ncbi:heparin/heparin-sulfate lyase HepB [Gemmatimonadota bacterium]
MRKTLLITLIILAVSQGPLSAGNTEKTGLKWKTLDDGVAVPIPPKEHPRLYLRSGHLEDLKTRIGHPVLKPTWDNLQKLGKMNAHYGMAVDALHYLLSGNRETGRRAVKAALDTLPVTRWRERGDVSRDIGRVMWAAAVVYDWCYDLLTGEEKEELVVQFIRLAEMFEIGYPIRQSGSLTGHIGEWMIMRDMLSAGVAIYDEYPDMYYEAAGKFFRDILPARDWFYPGGAYHQGIAYADTRFGSEMYPLWIFDRMGFGNVYHPSQQFVPYNWIYMRRPDGKMMTSGDDFIWTPKLSSLLCSSYYRDGYILADYLKDEWPFEILKHATHPLDQMFVLLWRDPGLEPWNLSELPLTRFMGFPNGWMVARTGWDRQSVIAEMKVNEYNFLNHQHQDAGAFQIYYKGPLAIDNGLYSGTGGGYLGPHNVNYYKRTIAHNSLLIYNPAEEFITAGFRNVEKANDGGQRLPNRWRSAGTLDDFLARDYKTGETLGHWFGPDLKRPDFSYLKGDITRAYSKKVKEVKRSFVFINLDLPQLPAALVVFDRVVSADPAFKKYWLLHSMEEPVVNGNLTRIALGRRGWSGKMANFTLLPEEGNFEIEKIGGPEERFAYFGHNFASEVRSGRNPEDYEAGDWRIQLSPARESATDLFLNAMLITDRDFENLPVVEKLENGSLVGVKVQDRVVFFNRSGSRTDRPKSFILYGEGIFKILVTDLSAGTWQIRKDGGIFEPAMVVNEESGVLHFKGPAGCYTLLR